jgi:hypothetical protein
MNVKVFLKISSWLISIAIGVIVVLFFLIQDAIGAAVAAGIVMAIACGLWGALLIHIFGARRLTARHLNTSVKKGTFLDKEVGATRVNDVRQALEGMSGSSRDGIAQGWYRAGSFFGVLAGLRTCNWPLSSGLRSKFSRENTSISPPTPYTFCDSATFRL